MIISDMTLWDFIDKHASGLAVWSLVAIIIVTAAIVALAEALKGK